MKSILDIRKQKSGTEREVVTTLGFKCREVVELNPQEFLINYRIFKGLVTRAKSIQLVDSEPSRITMS
ncbi:MAG: hypothetical protein DA330_07080, partial [Nitrososphaera sp.]|nr:hypothetical protein [Nitrososphaera sp.]